MADVFLGSVYSNLVLNTTEFTASIAAARAGMADLGVTAGVTGNKVEAGGAQVAAGGGEARAGGAAAAEGAGGFDLLGGSMLKTLAPLAALFIGYEGIKTIIGGAVKDTNLYNNAAAQITNTIKGNNQALGLNITQLEAMAESTAKGTTVTAAQNLAAENTLMNYTAIGKDVFPMAAKQIDNVATAMANVKGRAIPSLQDTSLASKMLGKALEDPAKGVTSLTRLGIAFSAAQTEQIKQMEKVSGVAAAQKLYLSDLADVINGKAAAATQTYQGKLAVIEKTMIELSMGAVKMFQNAMIDVGHVLETVGAFIITHKLLLTAVEGAFIGLAVLGVGALVAAMAPLVVTFIESALALAPFILGAMAIGAIVEVLVQKFGGWGKVMKDIKGPVNDVITAFKILFAALLGDDPTVNISPKWRQFARDLAPVQTVALDIQHAFKDIVEAGKILMAALLGDDPTVNISPKWRQFSQDMAVVQTVSLDIQHAVKDIGPAFQTAYSIMKPIVEYIANNLLTALKEAADSIGKALRPALDTLGSAFMTLMHALEPIRPYLKDIAIVIGVALLTPLALAVAALVVFSKVLEVIAPFIGDVIRLLADFYKINIDVAALLIKVVIVAFKAMFDIVKTIVLVIGAFFMGAYIMVKTALQLTAAIVTAVWNAIYTVVSAYLDLVYHVVGYVIGLALAIMIVTWNAIYNAVAGPVQAIWGVVVSVFTAIWNFIVAVHTAIHNFLWAIIHAIVDFMIERWNNLYANVSMVVSAIWNVVTGVFNAVYGFVAGIWDAIYNAVSGAIGKMLGVVGGIEKTVKSAVSGAIGWLVDAGKDLITGFINGIKGMGGKLASDVTGFIKDNVPGPILKVLGIHSPSTLMEGYGLNTVQGLALGITKNAGLVATASAGLAGMVAGPVAIGTRGGIAPGGSAAGGGSVTNFHGPVTVGNNSTDDGRILGIIARNQELADKGITSTLAGGLI